MDSHYRNRVDIQDKSRFQFSFRPLENVTRTQDNRTEGIMKASDFIAKYLEYRGVTTVFELVGGMITHLLDSLSSQTKIRIVSMHHEQSASFAAEAFGRVTGIPGIALATSGPGATNLLTGIGSCYFDSVPAIFITGQVNRSEMKRDKNIRQLGFQETDIVSMSKPITKWSVTIEDENDIVDILNKAFEIATSGRPGPVLIDIPMDIQRAELDFSVTKEPERTVIQSESCDFSGQLQAALSNAKRPLILAGGGIRSANSIDLFREFVGKSRIPVVHSLMGVDLLPFSHPQRVGMIGSYGNRWANAALSMSDVLLVLGSRLDIRQTGSRTDLFKGDRSIFHIDCESGEINNRIVDCAYQVSDLGSFLKDFLVEYDSKSSDPRKVDWLNEINIMRNNWPDTHEITNLNGINPNIFIHKLSQAARNSSAFVVDVGQHQMWSAQSVELSDYQRFLTSGGMGAMGFALPAAIGAYFANPGKSVTMIAGDGGFQLNIQELQTIYRNQIPIKMIILNNKCHGMVRQFQESYFDSRYQSTLWGYSAPDFTDVAKSYGIDSLKLIDMKDFDEKVSATYRDESKPFLLEVMIESSANAYPKMAFGRPINEMEPDFTPLDMEGT